VRLVSFFPAVCLVLLACPLGAVLDPVTPRLPVIPNGSGDGQETNRTTIVTNPQAPATGTRYRVRVWFVNGSSLEGSAVFPFSRYTVEQTIGGRRYYRTLTLDETGSIRVRRWVPVIMSSQGKELYYFLPGLYRILPKTGTELVLDKRMKMLDSFDIATPAGVTRVYSFFADYWIGRREDGHWENSGKRDFFWNNSRPHPGTVYRIDFLGRQTS